MGKQVLLVRRQGGDDFESEVSWLRENCELTSAEVPRHGCSAEKAASWLESHVPARAFELILLAQTHPGLFTDSLVNGLRGRWPLARMVLLRGGWCEGELRTGRPLGGVARVGWCELRQRLRVFLLPQEAADVSGNVSWNLPPTATEAERLGADLRQAPAFSAGFVVVVARNRGAYEPLADALAALGLAVTWHRAGTAWCVHRCSAVVWDMAGGQESEWEQLADLAVRLASAKLVVLAGFPRQDDVERVGRLGAVLLAKPFQLPDLWRELAPFPQAVATMRSRSRVAGGRAGEAPVGASPAQPPATPRTTST